MIPGRLQDNSRCRSKVGEVKDDVLGLVVGEAIACLDWLLSVAVTLHHPEVGGAPLHHPQVVEQVSKLRATSYMCNVAQPEPAKNVKILLS